MALTTQVIFVCIAAIIAIHYTGRSKIIMRGVDKAIFGSYGCIPAPKIEGLTMHYFKVRGRGEGIRIILQDNGVLYSEVNFSGEEWAEIKKRGIESGTFTFGQVPAITTKSGFRLVQSLAIVHYIGRSLGLDCECDDYHLCEVVALGAEDLRAKLGKVMYDPNFSMTKRNDYVANILPTWLSHFEKLAPAIDKESNHSFFISNRLTWIDYFLFDLIDINVEFVKHTRLYLVESDIIEDIFENFPKLGYFYKTFSQRPALRKYLLSNERLPFKLPYSPQSSMKNNTS